jgi:anthranilate phosphoribosyltransferase
VTHWTLEPEQYGLAGGKPEALAGGTPADNALTTRDILGGREKGVRRTAVVLNAAAALLVAGLAKDWEAGIAKAQESIDTGAGMDVLDSLITASKAD